MRNQEPKAPQRVLPISDGRGRLVENPGVYVMAAMVEPEGDPTALTLALAIQREAALKVLSSRKHAKRRVSSRLAFGLATMPRMEEVRRPEFSSRWTRGCLAGDLLLLVLSLSAHCPEHASLRKAIELMHRDMVAHGTNRTLSGATINYGKSYLESCWAEFKSVAHLYAAVCIARDGGFVGAKKYDAGMLLKKGSKGLLGLLACAELLRQVAEQHRPPSAERFSKGAESTLLRKGQGWTVPLDIELPPMVIEAPPPTDWSLEVLNGYRARGAGGIALSSRKAIA